MRIKGLLSVAAAVVALLLCSFSTSAQPRLLPQTDRVPEMTDLRTLAQLTPLLPFWAGSANDLSPIPDESPLRLTFVLTRSPERQAAFTQLLADQQNPASPFFHHWLTPLQVGGLYGPTQHDLDAFANWLAAQGLPTIDVAPSRVFLTVAAPASAVAAALHTNFRLFSVGGQPRLSATAEPSLPAAFVPLVQTIVGLSDARLNATHVQATPLAVRPQYTDTGGNHLLTPADFSVIYDLAPAANAGLTGTGQKVAIIGRSRVASSDVTLYEQQTGLPANLPNVVIPPTGVDPGIVPPISASSLNPNVDNDDQLEALLNVDRVLGTAPGVRADLVVSASTFDMQGNLTADGLLTAAQYEVQTLVDPVMNLSFSSCEALAGPSGVDYWDNLFAQASSEGITVLVASGDAGAAGCNPSGAVPPRSQLRSINSLCSSTFATCVGATEFADTANPAQYWSATNTANRASVLSYIPEGAWNDPTLVGADGKTINVSSSSGGGTSLYVPKPAWQTGTGVPLGNTRNVPDLSFAGALHDGYYLCYAAGSADCAKNQVASIGGTNAAASSMAAVVALLNQKTGTSSGNINPLLYRVAAATPGAFHDATVASSGVANCDPNVPSICNNSTPSPTGPTGGLYGYVLNPGYDQATGLGSLDIANFLNAAAAIPVSTLLTTQLALTESSSTIRDSQTGGVFTSPTAPNTVTFTARLTATGNPTGTVQFYLNGYPFGAAVAVASGQAVTPPQSFANAGYYRISAVYSGDTTFATSTAPGIALLVTGFVSITTESVSPTTIPIGSTAVFTASVAPALPSPPPTTPLPTPTGAVGVYIDGSVLNTANLNNGVASIANLSLSTPGTYQLTAFYYGDGTYSTSSSAAITVTVPKLPSTALIAVASAAPAPALTGTFSVIVAGASNPPNIPLPAPTGTVQLSANGAPLGAPIQLSANQPLAGQSQANSSALALAAAGLYTITASYSGDAFYLPTTSSPVTLTAPAPQQLVRLSAATPSLTLTAGNSATDLLTLASPDGDTGTFNMACTVSFQGTGTAISPPTCTLPLPQLTLAPGVFATQETLTIGTMAPPPASAAIRRLPSRWALGSAAFATLLCLIRYRRKRLPTLLAALVFCATFAATGCSYSRTAATTSSGPYTITVTATPVIAGAPAPAPLLIPLTIQ